MPKSKKSNSISQDYIIDLINQEYSELEKHLRNVLKNDNVTFNAYQKTLIEAKEDIFAIITGNISNQQDLGSLCDQVKKVYENDITAGFKKGRRKGRAISNNLSIVKKRIRGVQAKLNEDFNLPQQKDTAPIKQETNNVSPREKLMSALKGSEMDDDISTFFAERIKTFLTFGLESFYERIGKQVFHEKIAEENLIFIQRIFQYLYENIEEKVINIDNENLNFEKIKTTLKNTEQFKIYFNENKGKFCGENKEKQKILDIFIQEIISGIALVESCASLNDFLEQTLNEDRIPTSIVEFQDIFVKDIGKELTHVEQELIKEGYREELDSLRIVKNINSYIYGGVRKREEVDIFAFFTELETQAEMEDDLVEDIEAVSRPILTIPKKQKIQEPVRSSHKIKKTPTLKITEKPVIQATTETIQTTIEKQNNAHEIDGTLEKIQNMRSALHNEVERLINLEALIKFQRKLQENVDIHKQNITDLVEKYEFLIQQINQLEGQLQQIQEPLIELQSDIESEKSAVQFALHTKDNLPKEQKERIVNLHSSIQKYEAFTKKFNTLEDTIKKVIDDTNGSLRKYQESSRYLISGVQTQLLGANPNELLDINIPENSQNLDLEGLKKKIRYIELLERMILTLVDDSPITDSLKRNVDKILKKIEKKKTSSVVKKKTSEIDVRERVAEPIIQNNTVNISDIPDEVIKALKVLQVASPKPERGQNFGKTLKKLVGYLNISHGNYEPIDPKKEEQAIIWLEQQLDKFSIVFDEISRRPPTKAVLEKHEGFIIKWRFRNGSYMYLLPDTSMKQLDQVSIGDLTETQKLFIRKKVEQEKEDNTQKYVKKSA